MGRCPTYVVSNVQEFDIFGMENHLKAVDKGEWKKWTGQYANHSVD